MTLITKYILFIIVLIPAIMIVISWINKFNEIKDSLSLF